MDTQFHLEEKYGLVLILDPVCKRIAEVRPEGLVWVNKPVTRLEQFEVEELAAAYLKDGSKPKTPEELKMEDNDKACESCKKQYTPKGNNSKYCEKCRGAATRLKQKEKYCKKKGQAPAGKLPIKQKFASAPDRGDKDAIEMTSIVAEGVSITLSIRPEVFYSLINAAIKDGFGKKS